MGNLFYVVENVEKSKFHDNNLKLPLNWSAYIFRDISTDNFYEMDSMSNEFLKLNCQFIIE